MRKKMLLETEPTELPDIDEFDLMERGRTILARAQLVSVNGQEVLNIDLYTENYGNVRLAARYFASRSEKKFIAYITKEDRWSTAGIDNVANYLKTGSMDQNGNYYWRQQELWSYADSSSSIEEMYVRSYGRIQRWENEIRSSEYYGRINRLQARISRTMDETIPDIPEGFYTWVHEEIFGREYIYQSRDGQQVEMYCTHCGKSWQQAKGLRTGYHECPKCKAKALATFRDSHESKEEQLFLLQKCDGDTGEWVERAFRAKAYWERGHQRLVRWDERIRIIIPEHGNWGKCYYEDTSGEYWIRNTYNNRIRAGYLYPGSLQEVKDQWPEGLRYSGIDVLAEKKVKTNINNMIINSARWPYLEYIIKGRFYRLAQEIINESRHMDMGMLDMRRSRSAQELLRLGPSQTDRFRQMDGGFVILSWLQHECETGQKISGENLRYMDARGLAARSSNIQTALRYLTPNALVGYIRRQMEKSGITFFEGVLSTYCDYLDMARKQKLNLVSEIFYKPKNLQAAHDACVMEGKKHEIEEKAAGIAEKFPALVPTLESIREKYAYTGEEYSIVVPGKIEDIIREGRCLGHCIDTTDRYFDRICQGISYLVFLRRNEDIEASYYTLEIEPGGTVRQQRTTGNNQNKKDVAAYMPFIREWQQVVKGRMSKEDREKARKSRAVRLEEYRELREKEEKVWHGVLAGKLLADVLEADLIENVG